MNKVTLPGSIPWLLRRGSPVIGKDSGQEGVISYISDLGSFPISILSFDEDWLVVKRNCNDLLLDLEDPTGRAHAIWWLATNVKIDCIDFSGIRFCTAWRNRWNLLSEDDRLDSGEGDANDIIAFSYMNSVSSYHIKIKELETLDSDDKKLLPDGSRWVDAEALRRICLHVAGL